MYSPFSGRMQEKLTDRVTKWEPQLREFISQQTKPIILCGDLNVAPTILDRFKCSKTWPGCSDVESCEFYKLNQLLIDGWRTFTDEPGYTWGIHGSKLRIDYLLHSEQFKVKSAKVLNILGSDHFPVYFELFL